MPSQETAPLGELETRQANVYRQASPSVVSISNIVNGQAAGSGSGFVISREGYIVSNYHVVTGATELQVNFLDGTITRAEVIGLDPNSDLAVIRVNIPQERLFPLEFANSDGLIIGQNVVAIGSPFGQDWTLTSGVISALDREIINPDGTFTIGAAIQTDAPINPGNSGGPLLDLNGRVIGVNSQIISGGTRGSAGVGFAVPSNTTARVVNELITTGTVQYAQIGIFPAAGGAMTLELIESLGLRDNQRGVVIGGLVAGGPAQQAGLREPVITGNNVGTADVIVGINDRPVTSFSSLVSYLSQSTRPGDVVQLRILREGQEIILPVTLAAR
ncbi:MAG: trypsin-like peptidase domain-containing protein [Anaerolineae bacterium]